MRAQMGLSRSIVLHPALFIASKRKAVASLGGLFLRSGREHNKPVENSLARVHRLHLSLPMRQHLRVLSLQFEKRALGRSLVLVREYDWNELLGVTDRRA